MTQIENEVRQQLAQALIARAEADEKIFQLRAMLEAIKVTQAQIDAAMTEKLEELTKEIKGLHMGDDDTVH